jgi:hypothetical protein
MTSSTRRLPTVFAQPDAWSSLAESRALGRQSSPHDCRSRVGLIPVRSPHQRESEYRWDLANAMSSPSSNACSRVPCPSDR